MANIGSFKKVGSDFQGEIFTLSVQAKGVRIVAETSRSNENAPSHRVYSGRAEIGAALERLPGAAAPGLGHSPILSEARSLQSPDMPWLLTPRFPLLDD